MDAVLVVSSPSCSFSSSAFALSSLTQIPSTVSATGTGPGPAGVSSSLCLSRNKNAVVSSKRMLSSRGSSSSSCSSAGYSSLVNDFCSGNGTLQRQQLKQRSFRARFDTAAAADGAVALEASAAETTQGIDESVPIEKRYPAFPSVLDINAIRNILPHRFPFLLVDRVIEYNQGVSAVAIKNVTINDNFFPGHFPERPIMPGVLMVEAMAQVGGIVMLNPDVGGAKESFFFAGVDKVRFRKPVIAGDTLVMRMTLVKLQKRFGIAKMEGKAYVGSDLVCEGEFLMALGSSDE